MGKRDLHAVANISCPTDDLSTLAYPGTACLSRWAPACNVAVAASGRKHTQVWCCPESDFECVTGGNPYGPGERLCSSLLSTSTEVWVNRHTMTGSLLFEKLTIQPIHANAGHIDSAFSQGVPASNDWRQPCSKRDKALRHLTRRTMASH